MATHVQPEVLSDMLMWNALDKTREEIAQQVNADHGTDYSSRDVGEAINEIETQAENGDARSVYYSVHGRGLGVSIGSELATLFASQ